MKSTMYPLLLILLFLVLFLSISQLRDPLLTLFPISQCVEGLEDSAISSSPIITGALAHFRLYALLSISLFYINFVK